MRINQSVGESAPLARQDKKNAAESVVIIVDDDAAVREALSELILSAGFQPASFASSQEVLNAVDVLDSPGCLILDVHMPEASGLHLQHHLAESGIAKPIIFLTGHGDIPMTVQAMKAGAVDFLTKPVSDRTLLDAVRAGIASDGARRAEAVVVKRNLERLGALTHREREVLREVATRGRLNKQITFDLGISEVTVKLHRANAMRKMEVRSIGDLIRAWETLPPTIRETGGPGF
ncbi:LuxR family two component transcriptional regulator [Rhizobium azibense]|nr:LuxR family two component transcriptional regulator [Rhizobium azibense]